MCAVGGQGKTTTPASVKPPSTTLTSSSTSTSGKPATSTAVKPQESAKKKLEKIDLNAVKSVVFAELVPVLNYHILLLCFNTVCQMTGKVCSR